ncbi:MAG: TatD family hydrolase [Clostridia bacterium]|nr:TatD family hydrolase [Clostridia bacterium]
MKYFDSHAHYWDARFTENNKTPDQLIRGLLSRDIAGIVNVGTSPETSRLAKEQAERFVGMEYAAGIHPTDAQGLSLSLDEAIKEIRAFFLSAEGKRPVALGEIGLDYHYDDTEKELQATYFDAQLSLAEELNVPVIIHDRDAHADVFDAILRHPRVTGVMHSFSGSAEMAVDYARRGWYISFSGTVSFKNARKVVEAAAVVPDDKVLIETDAPYLAPHPYRGQRNDSGFLVYTNEALAAARGQTPEETATLTLENAKRLFGIR